MCDLTAERLREMLHYDPDTGVFTWCNGDGEAGYVNKESGYRVIMIAGRNYRAHRLAWLYLHGVWPADQIDHINLNRADNRSVNLRQANNQQNNMNNRGAGHSWCKRTCRWRAQIMVDRRQKFLGYHESIIDARAAYLRARHQYFGEFA